MLYSSPNHVIQLLAIVWCCFCACFLTGFFFWSCWTTARRGFNYIRRLHQIPCDRCVYFTGDYRLKCTVHPYKALTEEAIECLDFRSTTPSENTIPCIRKRSCTQRSISYQNSKQLQPKTLFSHRFSKFYSDV
jgi:hypothetical protein